MRRISCDGLSLVSDINIAYKKPAYQRQTYGAQNASLAVNGILTFKGDTDHEYSETPKGRVWMAGQWWMVDLGRQYSIEEIYLYNRHDISNCKYVYCIEWKKLVYIKFLVV